MTCVAKGRFEHLKGQGALSFVVDSLYNFDQKLK